MCELSENEKLIQYGSAVFIRRCPECGRFVKPYNRVRINDREANNAVCKKHGRVKMVFLGYY